MLGLFGVNADLLRQPKRRQPINDAKVHRLGAAAMLGVHHQRRNAKHLRRSQRMDVLARTIGFDQKLVSGEVRQQA